MTNNENMSSIPKLEKPFDPEIFVENINAKYGVAKPITRLLIVEMDFSVPKIYDELRRLGYPVPPEEK